jgi:hypothetical protein
LVKLNKWIGSGWFLLSFTEAQHSSNGEVKNFQSANNKCGNKKTYLLVFNQFLLILNEIENSLYHLK